ncbi:MAG: hypothetical protein IH845_01375 [Nanoarchaeota archaeon]|nr:hypothetical protein [Nanoarchaeota archaeon]
MNRLDKKKNVAVLAILLIMFSIVPLAFAEELILENLNEELEEIEIELKKVDAGRTPDQVLYGIDLALDRIRYALSTNKENTGLLIAEERLEEIKEMIKEGKLEEAEEAREKHEEILAKVKARVKLKLENAKDEGALRSAVKLERILSLQEDELQDLKERLSNLTPEEKRKIILFLLGSEESIGRIKLELEDAESNSLIKFEQKLGKSKLEIRDGLNRLREEKKVKAEILDNKSIVTIKYRFKRTSESDDNVTIERLIQRVLDEVKITEEEARRITKIEDGSDNDELEEIEIKLEEIEEEIESDDDKTNISTLALTGQVIASSSEESDNNEIEKEEDEVSSERLKLHIEIKRKDHRTEVEVKFRMRFLSGSTPESIYSDIAAQTSTLTIEKLRSIARIREEYRTGDGERKIEVTIRNDHEVAEVRLEWDGLKDSFRVDSTDKAEILGEIAARLGVSVEEVRAALRRYEQKEGLVDGVRRIDDERIKAEIEEEKDRLEEERMKDLLREKERLADELEDKAKLEERRLAEELEEKERLADSSNSGSSN